MISGEAALVVPDWPCRLNAGSQAASTDGEHHREVLGAAAGHDRVDRQLLDGRAPEVRRHLGDELVARRASWRASIASTRSRDGGTTGSPSVTPRSNQASKSSDTLAIPLSR